MTRQPADLEAHARAALHLLECSILLYRQGDDAFSRVAAVQLRILLCDTTRRHNRMESLALLPRIEPQLNLPNLSTGTFMSIQAWLEQPLPAMPEMSVRDLIRRVCDQDGGAHVDPHANTPPPPMAGEWIIQLGEILLAELVKRQPPRESRP